MIIGSKNNQLNIPQACETMERFKMQVASGISINP